MAKFAILRVQKLKSRVSLVRSLKHSYREQDTPNADEKLTPNNEYLESSNIKEAIDKYKNRLPPKVRKNAVHCIEYLITASPEAMQEMTKDQQDEYFKSSLQWLRDKHGAENVISVGVHRDETTPHMYAYVVPIDERGKLNCRAFLGEFDALTKMQTEFYHKVAYRCGLERGIEGSKAKHTRIKDFYKNIALEQVKINQEEYKKGIFESNEKYYDRVLNLVIQVASAVKDRAFKSLLDEVKNTQNELVFANKKVENRDTELYYKDKKETELKKTIREYDDQITSLRKKLERSITISDDFPPALAKELKREITEHLDDAKKQIEEQRNKNAQKSKVKDKGMSF